MKRLRRLLEDSPQGCRWLIPRSRDELAAAVCGAAARGYDGVLVAGGDGTIHDALPALRSSGLPFGVIPCGRGNDFARNIGMPRRLTGDRFRDSALVVRALDLPEVNGTPFGSIACLGFDAAVNRLARDHRSRLGGTVGYIACVARALRAFEPFAAEVEVDGRVWRGEVMLVAVANGPCYGGGMRIAPRASMDDGLLDVCIVQRLSKAVLVSEFVKVFRGAHVAHDRVRLERGANVRVSTEGAQEIYADGEYVGQTPATWTVRTGGLRVLLPAPREAARG